jgi:hypothetical protein
MGLGDTENVLIPCLSFLAFAFPVSRVDRVPKFIFAVDPEMPVPIQLYRKISLQGDYNLFTG